MQTQSDGAMRWGRQLGPVICAVVIVLATVAMFALKTLTPVVASRASVPSNEPKISSQAEVAYRPVDSSELQTPWDKGSLWDDEATAHDLTD
jgi:hypothetical protein